MYAITDNLTFIGTGAATSTHMNSVANGDNLFVFIAVNNSATGRISTVTDSSSNTYTKAGSYGGTNIEVECWYSLNATISNTTTLTITPTVGTDVWSASWVCTTGGMASLSFDKSVGASGTGTALDSTSTATTTANHEIVFGVNGQANNRAWTTGTGFTAINSASNGTAAGIQAQYKNVTSTGAYNETAALDISSNWVAAAFTFRAAPAFDVSAIGNSAGTAVATLATATLTTAGANELILASLHTPAAVTGVSVSGGGLTWASVANSIDANTDGYTYTYRAFATSAFAAAITFSWTTSVKSLVIASAFTGTESSGTSGSGAVGGKASQSGASATATVPLTSTKGSSLVVGIGTWNGSNVYTAPTGETATNQGTNTGGSGATHASGLHTRKNAILATSGSAATMGGTSDLSGTSHWVYDAFEILAPLIASGASYTQALTDTYTLSDSIIRLTGKVVIETVSLVETFTKQDQKPLSETFTLGETFSKQGQKALTETFSLGETFARVGTYFRSFTETFSVVETFTRLTIRQLADSLSLSDTLSYIKTKVVSFAETFSLVEVFFKSLIRSLTETFTLSEVFSSVRTYGRTFTETFTLVESFAKTALKSLVDTFSLSEIFQWGQPLSKTSLFSDANLIAYYQFENNGTDSKGNYNGTVTGGSYVTGKFGKAVALLSPSPTSIFSASTMTMTTGSNFTVSWWINPDSLTNYDCAVTANSVVETWGTFVCHASSTGGLYCGTDIATRMTPTDLPAVYSTGVWHFMTYTFNSGTGSLYKNGTSLASKIQTTPTAWSGFTLAGDTGTGADFGYADDVAVFSRALSATEVRSLYLATTSGNSYTKALSEAFTLVESFIKQISRTLSDTFSLTEAFSKLTGKPFTDTLSLLDSFTRVIGKNITEAFTLVETLVKQAGKAFTDTFSLTDSFSRLVTYFRTFTESLSVVETFIRTVGKKFTDTLTLTDSLTRLVGKVFTDSLSIAELFIRTAGKFLTDSLSISESFTTLRTKVANFLESFTLTDTISRLTKKALSETFSMAESLVKTVGKVLIDTLSIAESFVAQKSNQYTKTLTETITIAEMFARVIGKSLLETISLNESFVTARNYFRTLTDSLSLSDSLAKIKNTFQAFTDSLTVTDSLSRLITKTFTETLGLVESFLRKLNGTATIATRRIKPVISNIIKRIKPAVSMTKRTKPTTAVTKRTKPTMTVTARTKPTMTATKRIKP